MTDVLQVALAVLGGALGLILGFLIGKFADPYWRCLQLRKFTNKPYVVANLKRKDGVLITKHIVNTDKDVIVIGSDMWVIEDGTVYLTRNVKKNKKVELEILKETGYRIRREDLFEEQGCPTVYLNMDSIKPISLDTPESRKEDVKPSELGPTLQAWVFNQYAKGLAGINKTNTLMILILFGALASAGIGFMALQAVQKLDAKVSSFMDVVANAKATQSIQNGTIIIKQAGLPDRSMLV